MIFPLWILYFMKILMFMTMILVGVAFFTLMERKILGYIHTRFGPNKVGLIGLFQPFSDALKLFSKEMIKLKSLNLLIYFFAPLYGILISLMMWNFLMMWGGMILWKYCFIIMICAMSLSIYFLLYSGWSGNSKFSLLGSYRSSAQTLSYEIPMVFIIFIMFILEMNYSNMNIGMESKIIFLFIMCFIFPFWMLSCLAESNRTPFDFSEGESELVSGFNTEYSGGLFSLIFIGEYSSIMFLCFLSVFLFIGMHFMFYLWLLLMFLLFLWIRTTFPRLRYNNLMVMSWKSIILSTSFFFIFFMYLMKY